MALLARKTYILAKAEATVGTNSSPANTDAVLVKSLELTPLAGDVVSRDLIRGYLGNSESLIASTYVELKFDVELAGSGTAGTAPRYSNLLLACGTALTTVASTSNTYAPVSSSFGSSTIVYNSDGLNHVLTGCRGSFSISAEVGQIPTLSFSMVGVYNSPTDVSPVSASYTSQATPLVFRQGNTSAFSVFSYSGLLQSFDFDLAGGSASEYRGSEEGWGRDVTHWGGQAVTPWGGGAAAMASGGSWRHEFDLDVRGDLGKEPVRISLAAVCVCE
jgi:hypothetical protein